VSENIPKDLRYTKSHEWIRQVTPGTVEIGITDHAQGALGDLVFAEVPDVGRVVKAGDATAVVESVKAASDVYSPVAGKILAGNTDLANKPELLNQDPYHQGWIFRVETSADLNTLMSPAEYEKFLADESH
jgi:glycine cleavage system H protein